MLADRVALMFDGVVQQVGEPDSFYKRPSTTRVARFFRNSNFLQGVRSGDTVSTPVGDIEVDSSRVPGGEGPVTITVRPEEVEPVIGNEDDLNALPTTIESVIYMGTHMDLVARIGDSVWNIQAPSNFDPGVGDAVRFRLPKEHVWIVEDDSEPMPQEVAAS